jgi:hypothetical protein
LPSTARMAPVDPVDPADPVATVDTGARRSCSARWPSPATSAPRQLHWTRCTQSGDALALYNSLLMLDEAGSPGVAFDELSGEVHASNRALLLDDRFLRDGISQHLRPGPEHDLANGVIGVGGHQRRVASGTERQRHGVAGTQQPPAGADGRLRLDLWRTLDGRPGRWTRNRCASRSTSAPRPPRSMQCTAGCMPGSAATRPGCNGGRQLCRLRLGNPNAALGGG